MLRRFLRSLRTGTADVPSQGSEPLDAVAYWRDRLAAQPGLRGTGTSFLPDAWQQWLYRSKERAYAKLFSRNGVTVAGASILDFGCGTGYFEDLWARGGATEIAGIDIVPEAVAALSAAHPGRRYVCADLARDAEALDALPAYDIVTAIDVLYHVLHDSELETILSRVVAKLRPGGFFVFSDALVSSAPAPHVRFRGNAWWEATLAMLRLVEVDREPVAILHNRASILARVLPGPSGALQFYGDRLLLPLMPERANNWAILCRRPR